jgi:Domain of unknown function (DUF5666)/Domain of unknown function (DUF4382)
MMVALGIALSLGLSSCSGQKSSVCVTNCGGNGNATVAISIYDTPPTGVSVLSLSLPIVGITLTPSSGSPVSVFSPTSNAVFELTRLQTDSSLVTTGATVAAGTYTAINVTVGTSSGVFINSSNAAVGSCAAGAVCGFPNGAATTISYTFTTPLTLTSNQTQWIGLNLNMNNAITTTNGIALDFTQTGVLTATTTPRTNIPSAYVDTIEDFVGKVTAYTSGSTITVQNAVTGQSITATLNSSTEYDEAPSNYSACALSPACIQVGSTVSVDAGLAIGGTLTATEVDVLDASATDEVEGIIYPTGQTNVFGMILADKSASDANAALTAGTQGQGILLTINPSAVGYIDTKTLSIPLPNPTGFSISTLAAGQMVRAQISGASTNSNGMITATANNLLLRFSRLTATVNTPGTTFTISNPPTYMTVLNTGLSATPQVATYLNYTILDGLTTTTSLVTGETVAIRALYLSAQAPNFQAAKIRVKQ